MNKQIPKINNDEAQARNEKIKQMLANIPVMSKESMESNRRKIEQNNRGVEGKKLSQQLEIENEHNALLNELKAEVKKGAIQHAKLRKENSFLIASPEKKKNPAAKVDSNKKLID